MTKEEALLALKDGEKLSHRYFDPHEWVREEDGVYIFEDGCRCEPVDFWAFRDGNSWNYDWRIWSDD